MSNQVLNNEIFIARAKAIHGQWNYDYSQVEYVSTHVKVKIVCPKHGLFEQSPNHHINTKRKCPKCKYDYIKTTPSFQNFLAARVNGWVTKTTEQFIVEACQTHGDRYDYSKVNYRNNKDKVTIICRIHGEFQQRPTRHLHGQNCPHCNESRGENYIAQWLTKHKICFVREHIVKEYNVRKAFDFYLPELELLIEYDGELHFNPLRMKNGLEHLRKQQKRDAERVAWCEANNRRLLVITCHEDLSERLSTIF